MVLLAIAALDSAHAGTVILVCDGFAAGPGAGKGMPTGRKSFVVDDQKGIVQSSLGDFLVTHRDEREIRFEGKYQPQSARHGVHVGRIDRITGEAVTWVTLDGEKEPFLTFIMSCQPASPKF